MTAAAALREEVLPRDEAEVRRVVRATGFFSDEEVEIAAELVRAALSGPDSGYRFLFREEDGSLVAYACFGRIPCTRASWDLYWIATDPARQKAGVGRALLAASEERMRALGALRVYVETSSRAQYEPTRRFYERAGYERAALFPEFYGPGDGKVVYCKAL